MRAVTWRGLVGSGGKIAESQSLKRGDADEEMRRLEGCPACKSWKCCRRLMYAEGSSMKLGVKVNIGEKQEIACLRVACRGSVKNG